MRNRIMTGLITGLISLALFLVLAAGSGRFFVNRQEDADYPIVFLGDSIIGQVRDETSVTALLEERLEIQVFNGAMGGTGMSRKDMQKKMSSSEDSLSMAALASAIGYGDFGVQKTVQLNNPGTEYFGETIDGLEKIDFSQVEILFIEHGVNDYNAGVPIYNAQNPWDTYSYAGALRTSLRILTERFPELRIILVTPTYSWFLANEQTCEQWYSGYGYLEDYVEAQKHIAGEFGIELIDNYSSLYSHESWDDWQQYTIDGLHPNEEGRRLIADSIAQYLKENPQKTQ